MFALMFGKVVPKRLEVFDVTLRMRLLENGNLAIAAGDGGTPFFQIGHADEPAAGSKPSVPAPAAKPTDVAPRPSADHSSGDTSPTGPAKAPRRAEAMKAAAAGLRGFLDLLTDPHSAIAAVDRLGIARGTLVIEDEQTNERTVYKDFDLAFDKAHGVTVFGVSADGPDRRWSISAMASGTPGAERKFSVAVADLSLDEVQFATGTRISAIESDMPINASFDVGLKPDDTLRAAIGHFSIGPGFMRIDDPRPGTAIHQHDRQRVSLERRGATGRHRQPPLRRGGHASRPRRTRRAAGARGRPLAHRARDHGGRHRRARTQGPGAGADHQRPLRRASHARRENLRDRPPVVPVHARRLRDGGAGRLARRAAHSRRRLDRPDAGPGRRALVAGLRRLAGAGLDPVTFRGRDADQRNDEDRLRSQRARADARRPGATRWRRGARLHRLEREAAFPRRASRRSRMPRALDTSPGGRRASP